MFTFTSKGELVSITESAINMLVKTYQKSSYFFYTECDLHAYLFHRIFNSLPLEQWRCKTSSGTESQLIHREYPTKERYSRKLLKEGLEKGSRGHFDLTIWNPETTHLRLIRATNQNFGEEQHTFIAVEFDLEENNAPTDFALHHLQWDLLKLRSEKNAVEHGYLLVFARDWVNKDDFLKQASIYASSEQRVTVLYIDNSSTQNAIQLSRSQNKLLLNPNLFGAETTCLDRG